MEYVTFIIILALLKGSQSLNPEILKYDQYMKDFETTGRRIKQEAKDKSFLDRSSSLTKRESTDDLDDDLDDDGDTLVHSKELPLGITKIKEILEEGYVYVDKTSLIYDLLVSTDISNYFMIRPEGFGKTLFLSTLEQIFKGNRKLFMGTAISGTNYDWVEYPVLHFDFSKLDHKDPHKFEASLQKELTKMAKTNGVEPAVGKDFEFQLQRLIQDVSKKYGTRVVLLVDEYDSPIINSLNKGSKTTEKWQNVPLRFLTVVTDLSHEFLRFTFVTGVNQFSVCGPKGCSRDNLVDITLNPKYATLMGFTRSEIEMYFGDYLGKEGFSSFIWDKINTKHNGYRFSPKNISVYCPYATLNYLISVKYNETFSLIGEKIPSFLIDIVRKNPRILFNLENSAKEGFPLRLPTDVSKLTDLEPFLFQTGHLTIRGHDNRNNQDFYKLDFRNEQARITFFHTFLRGITELDPFGVSQDSEQIKQKLETFDMNGFIIEIFIHISRIPIQLRQDATLHYYQAVFYLLVKNFGLQTQIVHDCTRIELSNVVALFQFTINKKAETALELVIKEKIPHDKKTFYVGVNFGSESCNIYDWKGVLYDGQDIYQTYPLGADEALYHFVNNMTASNKDKKKKS